MGKKKKYKNGCSNNAHHQKVAVEPNPYYQKNQLFIDADE